MLPATAHHLTQVKPRPAGRSPCCSAAGLQRATEPPVPLPPPGGLKLGIRGVLLTWLPCSHLNFAACQTSGVPPPVLHGCSSQQQSGGPSVVPPLLPPLPWEPLLTAAQLRRGLSFYGSGARIERVAAKLLAGQPITAVTLGASVTRGHGASSMESGYPSRFFDFLNASFPHRCALLPSKRQVEGVKSCANGSPCCRCHLAPQGPRAAEQGHRRHQQRHLRRVL